MTCVASISIYGNWIKFSLSQRGSPKALHSRWEEAPWDQRNVAVACCLLPIRQPIPDLEHFRLLVRSTNSFQSCRLQSANTDTQTNQPSCRLQYTYTAKCTFPYCIILKGHHCRYPPQAATGRHMPADHPSSDGIKSLWNQYKPNKYIYIYTYIYKSIRI